MSSTVGQIAAPVKMSGLNIRTDQDGYLWGQELEHSQILEPSQRLAFASKSLIAERWICSDDPQYPSQVLDLHGKPQSLNRFLAKHAQSYFSEEHLKRYGPHLGSIMKLMETHPEASKGSHSVQVHPCLGDPELPAKPEVWLSLKSQSQVYLGWSKDVSAAELEEEDVLDKLNAVSLDQNQVLDVPGGVVHAIRYGSFLAEWSVAVTASELAKGGLRAATLALADHTDGKTPRPGKVNLPQALLLLERSEGFKARDPQDLLLESKVLTADEKGNRISLLVSSDQLCVQKIECQGQLTLPAVPQATCLFVMQGQGQCQSEQQNLELASGEEWIFPYLCGPMNLESTADQPLVVYRWWRCF